MTGILAAFLAVYLADSLFISSHFISSFYAAFNSKMAACLATSLAGLAIRQPESGLRFAGTEDNVVSHHAVYTPRDAANPGGNRQIQG
jgi:hypothetical protein